MNEPRAKSAVFTTERGCCFSITSLVTTGERYSQAGPVDIKISVLVESIKNRGWTRLLSTMSNLNTIWIASIWKIIIFNTFWWIFCFTPNQSYAFKYLNFEKWLQSHKIFTLQLIRLFTVSFNCHVWKLGRASCILIFSRGWSMVHKIK